MWEKHSTFVNSPACAADWLIKLHSVNNRFFNRGTGLKCVKSKQYICYVNFCELQTKLIREYIVFPKMHAILSYNHETYDSYPSHKSALVSFSDLILWIQTYSLVGIL